jgi:hypothetical protein
MLQGLCFVEFDIKSTVMSFIESLSQQIIHSTISQWAMLTDTHARALNYRSNLQKSMNSVVTLAQFVYSTHTISMYKRRPVAHEDSRLSNFRLPAYLSVCLSVFTKVILLCPPCPLICIID